MKNRAGAAPKPKVLREEPSSCPASNPGFSPATLCALLGHSHAYEWLPLHDGGEVYLDVCSSCRCILGAEGKISSPEAERILVAYGAPR